MKISVAEAADNNNISIRLSELMYLCFFCIMLFAKGIGLYDGQAVYKIILIVSFLCIGVKMCVTQHSYTEWMMILGLLAFSLLIYRHSGEKGILICMITVLAMKNVSLERVFRVGLVVWTLAVTGRFLTSLLFIENEIVAIQDKNLGLTVPRYYMGFPHPNVLHISYFILVAFLIYSLNEKYNLKHLCFLMLGNVFLFIYSYSLTGFVIVVFYLGLSYYANKKRISKMEYCLVELAFPACLLFSIALPVLADGKLFELADKVFNNRVAFSKYFLTIDNMSFIGNNLAAITTNIVTMDNSFVFALVIYGVPMFVLICLAYFVVIHAYTKEKKNIELAMIISFLVAGITEPFLFNTSFKNLTLLFIGEFIFNTLARVDRNKKQIAILNNKDYYIVFNRTREKNTLRNLSQLWNKCYKKILVQGTMTATILAILRVFFYQQPEYISLALTRQQESLIFLEKVRTVVTVFVFSQLTACIIVYFIYYVFERCNAKKNTKKIN